jgi:predicted metal-binding protein
MSSLLFKRFNSTLPPRVASLKELGKLNSSYSQAHPQVFAKMKTFYQNVPKGPKPKVQATTFWQRYYENYIQKDTLISMVHFLGVMIPVGYYLAYFKGGHCNLFTIYSCFRSSSQRIPLRFLLIKSFLKSRVYFYLS